MLCGATAICDDIKGVTRDGMAGRADVSISKSSKMGAWVALRGWELWQENVMQDLAILIEK